MHFSPAFFVKFKNQFLEICRPSMRKAAARNCSENGADGCGGGSTYWRGSVCDSNDDVESMRSGMTMATTMSASSSGLGVSAATFEQHSALIRCKFCVLSALSGRNCFFSKNHKNWLAGTQTACPTCGGCAAT